MELEDEAKQLIPLLRQSVIGEMGNILVLDTDPAAIGLIEQAENVKESAFSAAGRSDDCVDRAALELQRHAAECVDPIFVFTEIALDPFATERDFRVHEF